MKKYSLIFALASLCALFSSCDKDDKIGVVGTWELEKIVTEYVEDQTDRQLDDEGNLVEIVHNKGDVTEETPVEYGTDLTLTFRSDDLCIYKFTDYKDGKVDDEYTYVGPYMYDASKQTLNFYSVLDGYLTRLTETELQFTYEASDSYTIVSIEHLHFKRIK